MFLAACNQGGGADSSTSGTMERLACALDGGEQFAPACTVERSREDGGLFLTVRHPDGGFRRFEVLKDGRGLDVADGMQPAQTRFSGEFLEVSIATDRYRFPATAKDSASNP
ncbi:hypothetical protein [Croceicoccus estronivorus]|uniref:hypothetical protein n=1 Tax=Croceicoccus estronivorus TaxID=1172626 RepID=UPI000AEF63C0|nr:hypothetical protein [Croceicoccus estronivorus]